MILPTQTLIHTLYKHAQTEPNRVAFITGRQSITYGELLLRIGATARRLVRSGIKKGARVLLQGPNHVDFAVAYYAVHAVGAIAVPVDPTLFEDDLNFIINDTAPSLALIHSDKRLTTRHEFIYEFTLADSIGSEWNPITALVDDADILYTTGTTGRKKGVLLTQLNIAAAALNISSFIQNEISDLEVLPIPLSHSFGLGRLRSMALVGNTLALEPGLKNPALLLKRILDLRATGLSLVPAGFELMLSLTRGKLVEAQNHLRYIEIGSAPMRDATKQQLVEYLPRTRICHHYGLTEASRTCFREFHTDRQKPQSVGKPSPNVKISIFDDSGSRVSTGESGEIVVQGAMTMKRYWNRPDLDAKSYINGGLKTGDIGYTDEEGYVYLVGRQSDLINVGGLKVAPPEVESMLLTHRKIKDCACVGIPDKTTGEKIKIYYVADYVLDARDMVNWLRLKLEEYKIPKVFERIEKIPKTSAGKTQRNLLKQSGGSGFLGPRKR